jgi:hypothetical protein
MAAQTLSLEGIYEPSAVVQLSDGRFVVVEDESRQPFSVFTIDANGAVKSSALTPTLFGRFDAAWTLEDLEGLTLDPAGFLYAITSHSRDDDGVEKGSREKLIRFRINDGHAVEPRVTGRLKQSLTDRFPTLASAAAVHDVKDGGGLNIEALAFDPRTGHLLIGFRGPLVEGRALVARLLNAGAVFDLDAPPNFAPMLDELDMDGRGIRDMSYVPLLQAFLVIGGPLSKEDSGFGLWLWSGDESPTRPVNLRATVDVSRAEGVAPAKVGGADKIILVFDDGDRDSGRNATACLLEPQLFVST